MSAAPHLVHTCAACGAEEALDTLIARMIDDDSTRRLIADVIMHSLPLGGQVVRYLRLHKPAKHRLRLEKVRQVLGELVPAVVSGRIQRKGGEWTVPDSTWKAAFSAVFDSADKGTLDLPLDGNAYLFEVAMRMIDRAEAAEERSAEADRRQPRATGPVLDDPQVVPQVVAPAGHGLDVEPHGRTAPPPDVIAKLKVFTQQIGRDAPTGRRRS